MSVNLKIKGYFNQPMENHKFFIEGTYEWIKLKIFAKDPKWFKVLLWDSNKILRLQYLYCTSPKTVIIHNDKNMTSSGTIPGPIVNGQWMLEIFGFSDKESFEFDIDIICGNDKIDDLEQIQFIGDKLWVKYEEDMEGLIINNYDWNKKFAEGKRWYKGDFHTHTNLSDGKLSPAELLVQAGKQNLDFFVTTEHNIIHTGFPKSNILVLPGIEITDLKGHFNALGITRWIDWTPNSEDGGIFTDEGMNRLLEKASEAKALCSINHPTLKPWAFRFMKTALNKIDTIEIWNDPTFPQNNQKATEEALSLWNILWQDGYIVWGIGGSDAHNLPSERYEKSTLPSIIGDPGTYVLADSLCAKDVIEAVKKGRVYVSRGPQLDLKIVAQGNEYFSGADISCLVGESEKEITYKVSITNVKADDNIIWIENGEIIAKNNIGQSKELEYVFTWKGKDYKWLRFEIRDKEEKLLAFVNPIYKGKKNHNLENWEQLIEAGGIELD